MTKELPNKRVITSRAGALFIIGALALPLASWSGASEVFGPMEEWYDNLAEQGTSGQTANVSSSEESDYLRPYRVILNASNFVQNGYSWHPAHYLEPIAMEHFIITSETPGDVNTSVIYQNPGWPMQANEGAE